jgi:hypothetical protein
MSTGSAKILLGCAMLIALGGCATGEPVALLSAAELESMIRVEIVPLEPGTPDETTTFAAVQP